MPYPRIPDFNSLIEQIRLYSQLKHEQGAKNIVPSLKSGEKDLSSALLKIKKLPVDPKRKKESPTTWGTLNPCGRKGIAGLVSEGMQSTINQLKQIQKLSDLQ